jgi:hypothetical protein
MGSSLTRAPMAVGCDSRRSFLISSLLSPAESEGHGAMRGASSSRNSFRQLRRTCLCRSHWRSVPRRGARPCSRASRADRLDTPIECLYTCSMAKQIIVEIDEYLARELERAAPAHSRQRSSFIRAALRRELDRFVEARMAEAYRAQPDTEPPHFDPRLWESAPARKGRRRRRR